MEIVTLSYNRPDFIELQLDSIRKFHKDFTYTVFDNSPDDSIKDECKRLGVKCVPIKIFSADPSYCVGLSLNKMWETLQHNKGTLVYLDSDMFLIGKLPSMKDHDFAFVPQTRENILYPWTGLMLFNMDTLPVPHELQWEVDKELLPTCDVGGLNHFYLLEHKPKVLELEMWTLISPGKSYNGSDVVYDHYNFEKMEKLCVDFPSPVSVDMFKVKDDEWEKCFVFHYKSASNYPPFYTPEYNRLKTIALRKLLCQ